MTSQPDSRLRLSISVASLALGLMLAPAPSLAQQAGPPDEAGQATGGKPLGEAGIVAGGARVVDYPGADQSHPRGLVAPFVIYRGPILRVDQRGVRGRLLDTPDWELNLSATAAFNVRNNDAREGMPALDYLFGVGPQLIYKGLRGSFGDPTLYLKTRATFSTNFHQVHSRGLSVDPEVRWRMHPFAESPTLFTLTLQPTWTSRALQGYFYDVEASQATPTRPTYRARAGYLGTEASFTLTGRSGSRLSWFASVRAMSLHGAANTASPLLRDRSNVSVGAGVLWTLWQNEARAGD